MFQTAENKAERSVHADVPRQGQSKPAKMTIEFGYRLVPMFDDRLGGRALATITATARRAAAELGIERPIIELRQNLFLMENQCRFVVNGTPTTGAIVDQGRMRAIRLQHPSLGHVEGEPGSQLCGLDSHWVTPQQAPDCLANGYRVLSPQEWLAALVETTLRDYGHLLICYRDIEQRLASKRETRRLAFRHKRYQPRDVARLGLVLRRLAKWRIPLGDIDPVLESLTKRPGESIDSGAAAEYVRRLLVKRQLDTATDSSGRIRVIDMDTATRTLLTDIAIEFPYSSPATTTEMRFFVRQLVLEAIERLAPTGNQALLLIPLELSAWCVPMFGYNLGGVPVITREDLPEGHRVEGNAVLCLV